MKKWIGFVLILAGLIYVLVSHDSVCRWVLAKVELDEGPYVLETWDKAKFYDLKVFCEKYLPLMERRSQIAKVAFAMGNTDLCLEITTKAVEMYKDCALEKEETYQDMLLKKGVCLEDKGEIAKAKLVMNEFIEKFPQNKQIDEARQRREKLDIAAASH
jgi:hypothetical protein